MYLNIYTLAMRLYNSKIIKFCTYEQNHGFTLPSQQHSTCDDWYTFSTEPSLHNFQIFDSPAKFRQCLSLSLYDKLVSLAATR